MSSLLRNKGILILVLSFFGINQNHGFSQDFHPSLEVYSNVGVNVTQIYWTFYDKYDASQTGNNDWGSVIPNLRFQIGAEYQRKIGVKFGVLPLVLGNMRKRLEVYGVLFKKDDFNLEIGMNYRHMRLNTSNFRNSKRHTDYHSIGGALSIKFNRVRFSTEFESFLNSNERNPTDWVEYPQMAFEIGLSYEFVRIPHKTLRK